MHQAPVQFAQHLEDVETTETTGISERSIRIVDQLCEQSPRLIASLRDSFKHLLLSTVGDRPNITAGLEGKYARLTELQTIVAISDSFKKLFPQLTKHLVDVQHMSHAILLVMNRHTPISREDIEATLHGAFLHDIGKLDEKIRELISQNRRLTPEEVEEVANHAILGDIVLRAFEVRSSITDIALLHHATTPHGKKFKSDPMMALSLPTKIVTVADSVQAMMAERPGNGRKSVGYVMKELRIHSGELFDTYVCNAVIEIFKKAGFSEDSDDHINARQLINRSGTLGTS